LPQTDVSEIWQGEVHPAKFHLNRSTKSPLWGKNSEVY